MSVISMRIEAETWSAHVLGSRQGNGGWAVECTTLGRDFTAALDGARECLDMFAKGRAAAIRVEPEADSYKDFDTKITHHKGYVRFTFFPQAGDWQIIKGTAPIPYQTGISAT